MPATTRPTSEILSLLASRGLTASAQRVVLLDALLSSSDHLSADDLYRRLSGDFPTLSRATVYNNLAALASAGIIEKLDTPDGSRYGKVAEPHVNLVCTRCGAIVDVLIGSEEIDALVSRAADEGRFAASAISLSVMGLCSSCQAASPAA